MKVRLALALIAALCFSACAYAPPRPPVPAALEKFAVDLLDALSRGEHAELARFVHDKREFSVSEYAESDYDFLYVGSFAHANGLKTVHDIIAMGQTRHRTLMAPNGKGATIFYYPAQYSAQASHGLGFFKRTWMEKSFACEVNLMPEGWTIRYGFCFNESEGPFPPDID